MELLFHTQGSNDLNISVSADTNETNANFISKNYGIYELMPNGSKYDSSTMANYVYFQFNNGTVQNLMFSNYVDPSNFNISVEIQSGKIALQKTNNLGNPVSDCVFELYRNAECTDLVKTATTGNDGRIIYDKLKPMTYYIKEKSVATGYLLDTSIQRVDVVAGQTSSVTFKNNEPTGQIKVYKVSTNNDKIAGAEFEIKATKDIYDRATGKIIWKKGEAISQKIGSTTYNSFTTNADNMIVPEKSYTNNNDDKGTSITPLQLPVGSYAIYEINTPKGFLQLETPVKFDIKGIRDYDKDQDEDFIKEVIIKNEQPTGTLIIDKTITLRKDIDTSLIDTSDLSGIEFKLIAKEDIIDYADGSKIYLKGQEVKTYNLEKNGNLKIENLPMGTYELEETKTLNGLVLNGNKYEIKFEQEDLIKKVYEVKENISNDTTIFEFSKKDITGDNELEGAKLSVIDENDNIIDTWTSTKNTHKIEGLVVGKTYKLKEEISPDGYVRATTIEFKVENTTEIQKVEMVDKIVTMSKKDIGGNEIEGAIIKVFDKDGNIIDEWISTKEPHKVKGLEENNSMYSIDFENDIIEVPNTGDNRYTGIFALIGVLSAILFIVITAYEYKKRKNNI